VTGGYLPVAGTGWCLPATGGADAAPSRPVRLAGLPRESRVALRAAADALGRATVPGPPGGRGDVGVVWVSSTAGLEEYGETCLAAATQDPSQTSPLTACESAFNGPAAAVSIRLGLTGPHLTLTGCRDAGASAVFEAGRLLAEGSCAYVLVGGSASVGRWRSVGDTGETPGAVPAEGAVCLLLGRPADPVGTTATGTTAHCAVRPLARGRLVGREPAAALAVFVKDRIAALAGPPDAVAVSAAGPGWVRAMDEVDTGDARRWWVDRTGGDLGAAGGLHAVAAAVAGCGVGAAGFRVLALALGTAGQAASVEVVSRGSGVPPEGEPE
jgi:hypothetical protein